MRAHSSRAEIVAGDIVAGADSDRRDILSKPILKEAKVVLPEG